MKMIEKRSEHDMVFNQIQSYLNIMLYGKEGSQGFPYHDDQRNASFTYGTYVPVGGPAAGNRNLLS